MTYDLVAETYEAIVSVNTKVQEFPASDKVRAGGSDSLLRGLRRWFSISGRRILQRI